MHIEPSAVFFYHRHFTVIQIDDLTMPPHKGGFLLFEIFRIYRYFKLFPGQLAKFSVKVKILDGFFAIYREL